MSSFFNSYKKYACLCITFTRCDTGFWLRSQVVSPAIETSSPPAQTKRRLAFEPSPDRRKNKGRNKAAKGKATRATSEPSPHSSTRGRQGRATASKRRSRDRRRRLVSLAKARLTSNCQKGKATGENRVPRQPRSKTRAETSVHANAERASDNLNRSVSLRPRRARVASDDFAVSRQASGSDAPKGNRKPITTSHGSKATINALRDTEAGNKSRVVRHGFSDVAETQTLSKSLPLPQPKASSVTEKEGGQRPGVAKATDKRTSNDEAYSKATSSGRRSKTAKKLQMRKQPPPGVTIRP